MPQVLAQAPVRAGSFHILSRPAKQSQSGLGRDPISVFPCGFS
jgi:hypothetical protein